MIDLHCHILHAIDDGPRTVNESIQLAQALVKTGFRTVVATPHMVPGTPWMPSVDKITSQIARLNKAMQLANLNLQVVAGMEIALDPQIPDLLDDGSLLPLGDSSCLLIEPSFQGLPPGWVQVVFSILAKGYSILLAHPERCPQLAARLDLVEELMAAGVYLQVNWGSFHGQFGGRARRAAVVLATNGWIHCLATDSHRPNGRRFPDIPVVAAKLSKMIGQANLKRLTLDNPLCLLRGDKARSMTITGPMVANQKKWWRRLW